MSEPSSSVVAGLDAERPIEPLASVDAQVAAWRAQGAHGHDPVAFHHLETLARRAAGTQGAVREWLDRRVQTLLADYGQRLAAAVAAASTAHAPPPRRTGLGALLDAPGHGNEAPAASTHAPLTAHAPGSKARASAAALPAPGNGNSARPELKALREHKRTWSRLRVEQRMSRSLAQRPGHAGPLNSHGLVLRALEQMQALSPDYLDRFMAHIEALQWLEKATGGPPAGPRDVLRNAGDPAQTTGEPAAAATTGKPRQTRTRRKAG